MDVSRQTSDPSTLACIHGVRNGCKSCEGWFRLYFPGICNVPESPKQEASNSCISGAKRKGEAA